MSEQEKPSKDLIVIKIYINQPQIILFKYILHILANCIYDTIRSRVGGRGEVPYRRERGLLRDKMPIGRTEIRYTSMHYQRIYRYVRELLG